MRSYQSQQAGPQIESNVQAVGQASTMSNSERMSQLQASQGTGSQMKYTVKAGDNLWAIAERFLGDGQRWREIARINNTSSAIDVGQILTLPIPDPNAQQLQEPVHDDHAHDDHSHESSPQANPNEQIVAYRKIMLSRIMAGEDPHQIGPYQPDLAPPRPQTSPIHEYLPLQRGSKGAGVVLLQERLNSLGAHLVTDGDYGAKTQSAVQVFQIANGLSKTGNVDAQSALKLFAADAKGIENAQMQGVPGAYLGEYDAYRDGKHIGNIDVVEMDGKKVAAKTAKAWKKLKDAAAADGVYLILNSGFRTMDEQKHLYQKYGSPRAAYPGWSNHQHGQAMDIDMVNPEHYRWMFANAPSYGWRNTVSFEPWHWEYFGD